MRNPRHLTICPLGLLWTLGAWRGVRRDAASGSEAPMMKTWRDLWIDELERTAPRGG